MSDTDNTPPEAPEQPNMMREGDRVAGGAEQHVALRAWARTNIPKSELEEMNSRVRSDPSYYPKMVQTLRERQRGGGVTPDGAPFVSNKEMFLAMEEATKKHGAWEKDPALMKRINATPKHIKREI